VIDYDYNMNRTSDAAVEPITVDEARLFARQDDTTDDDQIRTLIVAAREWVENYTARALITQTWTQKIDWRFPPMIILPFAPLQSVTSIAYTDTAGSAQTLASSQYTVDTQRKPGRVFEAYSVSWPSTRYIRQAITVTYVAGYGASGASVPEPIKLAIKQLVLHWYDQRAPVIVGTISKEIELAVKSLLSPYKVRT